MFGDERGDSAVAASDVEHLCCICRHECGEVTTEHSNPPLVYPAAVNPVNDASNEAMLTRLRP